MPTQTVDPTLQELLRGRYIATLGTENPDWDHPPDRGLVSFRGWLPIRRDFFQEPESPQYRRAGEGFPDGGRAKTWSGAGRERGRESGSDFR
jgi:hypothetical protein